MCLAIAQMSGNTESPLLKVLFDDNSFVQKRGVKTWAIRDLLQSICGSEEYNQYRLSSYGSDHDERDLLQDVLPDNPIGCFLVSKRNANLDVTARYQSFVIKCEAYRKYVDLLVKSHWESFSHDTCSLFSFCAEAYISSSPTTGTHYPPYEKIYRITQAIANDPQSFSKQFPMFMAGDPSSGDCTLNHFKLMQKLTGDFELHGIRWSLFTAERLHTCLGGLCLDGTFILVDVGVLRRCEIVQMGSHVNINARNDAPQARRRSTKRTPAAFRVNHSDRNRHWPVVEFKVQHLRFFDANSLAQKHATILQHEAIHPI